MFVACLYNACSNFENGVPKKSEQRFSVSSSQFKKYVNYANLAFKDYLEFNKLFITSFYAALGSLTSFFKIFLLIFDFWP